MAEKELYTIKEIAHKLNVPESTVRYWRDRYTRYTPSVGKNKFRKYREEALEALRVIKEGSDRNKSADQIEDALKDTFGNGSRRLSVSVECRSKLYFSENRLQEECAWKLQKSGFHFEEYNNDITGFEIDILTSNYCLEVKIQATPSIIYTAIGQLMVNKIKSGLKPGLVLPSDVKIRSDLRRCLKELEIDVFDEQTIIW